VDARQDRARRGEALGEHDGRAPGGRADRRRTDAGTPFNPHGNLPRELELLSSVGLSPLEVLQAATTVAADALALMGQVGTLAPGAWADLVAWDRDRSPT
jgi:predicted amidohydrolase YtcJ